MNNNQENAIIINTNYENEGECNVGNNNDGNYNYGDNNFGGHNLGDNNVGYDNNGNNNGGKNNCGVYNGGDYNLGYLNIGSCNNGDCNSGNHNNGNNNGGYCNSGDWNTGNNSSGDYNIANNVSGCFNTEKHQLFFFDKPTDMTAQQWNDSRAKNILKLANCERTSFVKSSMMTDHEKEIHPDHIITGGYFYDNDFHRQYKQWWAELSNDDKNIIKAIPNFDAEKFSQITGIDVGAIIGD